MPWDQFGNNTNAADYIAPEFLSPLRRDALRVGCFPKWRSSVHGWGWYCECTEEHGMHGNGLITAATLSRCMIPTFTDKDELFMGAIALGCTPVWDKTRWECHCPKAVHGVNQEYRAVSLWSLGEFRRHDEAADNS